MGYAHIAKDDIYFTTEVEKTVHKILSGMRYGQKVQIDLSIAETKEQIAKAIKKSSRYNCMDIRVQWPKNNSNNMVTITVE